MDGTHFDALAKRLATEGFTRRRIVQELIGGLAGVVTGIGVAADETRAKTDTEKEQEKAEKKREHEQEKAEKKQEHEQKKSRGNRGCPAGQDRCGHPARCVDLETDPANCGACGQSCAGGRICANGACLTAQGGACASGEECATGYCADGVCCDAACTGQCEACDASGTCRPFSGSPSDHNRTDCAGAGPICQGTCDGINGERCSFPPEGTPCGQRCDGGNAVSSHCTGNGVCAEDLTVDCGPGVCTSGVCVSSCQDTDDCAPGAYCTSEGVCADCVGGSVCGDGTCQECCSNADCTQADKAFCPYGGGECTCGVSGQVCDGSHLCCDGFNCQVYDIYTTAHCCKLHGESCIIGSDHVCCGGICGADGTCP